MGYSYDRQVSVLPGWQERGYERQDAKVEAHGIHGRWAAFVMTSKGRWRLVRRNMKDETRAMALADKELAH